MESLWEKQMFILKELQARNAQIQPIDAWDFQNDVLFKYIDPLYISVCFDLLKDKKLVKIESNGGHGLRFHIWLNPLGLEEIQRDDDKQKQLADSENKEENQKSRELRLILLSGLIGLVSGISSALIQVYMQKETILNPTVLPKIQVLRETVYVNSNKQNQDTALVRIVKQPVQSVKKKKGSN